MVITVIPAGESGVLTSRTHEKRRWVGQGSIHIGRYWLGGAFSRAVLEGIKEVALVHLHERQVAVTTTDPLEYRFMLMKVALVVHLSPPIVCVLP